MLTIPTLERLRELKFHGMAKSFEEQLRSSGSEDLNFEERLSLMVDQEMTERENRRLKSRLRQAKLRQQACMEDIDYRHSRRLDKSLMMSLKSCKWVRENLNVIITGPTGAGKSFIACALGHRACMEGYRSTYFRAPRLFHELAVARRDGKMMNAIAKSHLLIIDDWGLSALTEPEQRDLLEILEERHDVHSTIMAGQLPVEHWHETISNPTLARCHFR